MSSIVPCAPSNSTLLPARSHRSADARYRRPSDAIRSAYSLYWRRISLKSIVLVDLERLRDGCLFVPPAHCTAHRSLRDRADRRCGCRGVRSCLRSRDRCRAMWFRSGPDPGGLPRSSRKPVKRENHVRAVADGELRFNGNAGSGQRLDFLDQRRRIDHHSVADYGLDARAAGFRSESA